MSWLSEDPMPLAGVLGVLAVVFLVLLKLRQQGKYLIWAGIALLLALAVVLVEQVWVTDRERIEAVVYDLADAVERSDADAALSYMTPDVSLTREGVSIGGPGFAAVGRLVPGMTPGATNPARAMIRGTIQTARFDFLTVSHLDVDFGRQTRMGTADFRVHAGGSFGSFNFLTPSSGTDWSLGVREVDDQWKVQSITATRLPRGYQIPGLP